MVFNVVVLALPLSFLVLLTSDRELLGDLATRAARSAPVGCDSRPACLGRLGMIQYLT